MTLCRKLPHPALYPPLSQGQRTTALLCWAASGAGSTSDVSHWLLGPSQFFLTLNLSLVLKKSGKTTGTYSVAKLTPPPLFLSSSMYDLPWGEGRKKIKKKNYVITKTIVSARLFFLFSFGLRGFFFVYFIFVEYLLFHSIPAFDFLSKIEMII